MISFGSNPKAVGPSISLPLALALGPLCSIYFSKAGSVRFAGFFSVEAVEGTGFLEGIDLEGIFAAKELSCQELSYVVMALRGGGLVNTVVMFLGKSRP